MSISKRNTSWSLFFHVLFMFLFLESSSLFASNVNRADSLALRPAAEKKLEKFLTRNDKKSFTHCGSLKNSAVTGPALVFNHPDLLEVPFNFKKTIQHILKSSSSKVELNITPHKFMNRIIKKFNKENKITSNGVIVPIDIRLGEAQLNPETLLDSMKPVALFNRFDLASTSGQNCGEYRIVYALESNEIQGRLFFIFEALAPNPFPAKGLEGCRPLAQFWGNMSSKNLNNKQRVAAYEAFYYQGLSVNNKKIRPIIHWQNYTKNTGQIRSNHFINFNNWQLRDFVLDINAKATNTNLGLRIDPTDNSPLSELATDDKILETVSRSGLRGRRNFEQIRSHFQNDFIFRQIPLLSVNDLNSISMNIPLRHNDFQSHAQVRSDQMTVAAGVNFKAALGDRLIANRSGLTVTELLARSDTQTCGGCHQLSNGASLGNGLIWPNSLGFVHVNEQGNLSAALIDVFLPARKKVLTEFLGCQN